MKRRATGVCAPRFASALTPAAGPPATKSHPNPSWCVSSASAAGRFGKRLTRWCGRDTSSGFRVWAPSSGAPPPAGFWGFFHLYEDLRERGYAVDLRVVASQIVAADSPIAAHRDVPESAPLILIRRLVMLDGEPFRLVNYFAPSNRFARLLEEDLSHTPLSELVQRHYGIHFTRLQKWLEPALAQGEAAHLLGLSPGEPVLRIEVLAHGIDPSQGALPAASRIVDAGDDPSEPIDFRRILMRADKCRFFVEIEER